MKAIAADKYRPPLRKHDQLHVAVIAQFAPRFAPPAKLLYSEDTANRGFVMEAEELKRLGFPMDKRSKWPNVVLYWPRKKWLYLIEVAGSHGPISPKRYQELEALLSECPLKRKFVTVFGDFKEYSRHRRNLAWNTDAWIAEAPDHLIHYNGDKFIGPRQSPPPKRKAK